MRVKGTVKAWTTSEAFDFDFIQKLIEEGKQEQVANHICFTASDMSNMQGWVEVGVASMTVEFFPYEAIVSKQTAALEEELRQYLVNAERGAQAIRDRISKLTAITA